MKIHKIILPLVTIALTSIALSCRVSIPKGASAVTNFDINKYLGKWYEIARLDFKFEKGLNNTTAVYSLKKDGSIRVENSGYDYTKNKWKKSIGKAKPVNKNANDGKLKVSFFGPFYSGYNVIALDDDYKYVLIAGDNLKYLWILSRTSTIPDDIKNKYVAQAKSLGYKTEDLIWVEHDKKK